MNTRRWLLTLGACVLLFAGLALYKTLQIRSMIAFAESFPEPSETVEVAQASPKTRQAHIETLGEVVAPETVSLRNELEGRVTQVGFKSGSLVKQGQLLLQLDISEEQARLKAAQARLKLAKLDLERIRKLRKNRTVSEERLDQAEAQYDIATADIAALEATIRKKTLRAPFDAYTGLHEFEIGELLATNTLITTLVGINDYVWVDFTLPLGKIDAELGTQVRISRSRAQINGPKPEFDGVIIAKDSVMSASSRNMRFRARVNTEQLPHNAAVNVEVATSTPISVLTVPATAVRSDGMGDYVYTLSKEPEGAANAYRAQRRSIVISPEFNGSNGDDGNHQFVAVSKGLSEGELIAASGAFKLREGLLTYAKERVAQSEQ